jgi:hypothetical protein
MSHITPTPPALADPTRAVQAATYYDDLHAALMQSLGTAYGTVLPFASAETVNWYWGEVNPGGGGEVYNAATYDFLNTRVALIDGVLQPQGGALNVDLNGAYQDVTFAYSSDDQNTLNQAKTSTAAEGDKVVQTYQSIYGTITSAQLATATAKVAFVVTPLDYVVEYMIRYVWAGVAPTKLDGSYNLGVDPYVTPNLASKLPFLPASAGPVMAALGAYLAAVQPVAPLREKLIDAMYTVHGLVAATATPAGMTLVNPIDGSTTRQGLQWTFGKSVSDLLAGLSPSGGPGGGSLEIGFTVSSSDGKSLDVVTAGGASVVVPVGEFLEVEAQGSAAFQCDTYLGGGTSLEVSITYPGLTTWGVSPQAYDGAVGWYDSTVLQQAVTNGPAHGSTAASTGYALSTTSPYDWTDTGTFGVYKMLVVSRAPSVTITYKTDQESDFYEHLTQQAQVGVRVLGVDLFSAKESTEFTDESRSTQNGSFSVTIAPPVEQATGLQSQAWVVGAVVRWPGEGDA